MTAITLPLPRVIKDNSYLIYYSWLLLTFILIQVTTSASNISYLILIIGSLYQITQQKRWKLLLEHPFTRLFWSGALLVFIGLFYSKAPLHLSLLVAKKYVWLLVTPFIFISLYKHQPKTPPPYKLYFFVTGLMLVFAFYRLLTDDPTATYQHFAGYNYYLHYVLKDHLMLSVLFLLGLAASPVIFIGIDKTQPKAHRPYTVYLHVVLLTLLVAFYRVLTDDPTIPGHDFKGFNYYLNCPFKDHIIQSLLFAIGLAISLFRVLHTKDLKTKCLSLLFVSAIAFDILFINDGRTGYILIAVILLYTCITLFRFKNGFLLSIAALLILFSAFHFSPAMQDRWQDFSKSAKTYLTNDSSLKATSLGVRLANWKAGYALFKKHPLIGHGTGGIKPAYDKYYQEHPDHIVFPDKLLDSSYLNFAVQYGLLGIAFCICFFVGLWRLSHTLAPFEKYLTQVILLSFIVMLWINPWLSSSTPSHLASVFLALLYAAPKSKTSDSM